MPRGGVALGVCLLALVSLSGSPAAKPPDRLEQFRELAERFLGALEAHGPDGAADVSPLYALIDEEVIESLESGGPFASAPFIQGQLDGFASAWGGVSLSVQPVGGPAGHAPLIVGTFTLGSIGRTGSVRVYARGGTTPGLLAVSGRAGVPEIIGWPSTRNGQPQFMVRWSGETSGHGTRALRLDLWRQTGPDEVRVVWSTADRFPEGLWVEAVEIRPGEIVLRYEARYPGWKPGCADQTEHEDVYAYLRDRDAMVLAREQVLNGWHRELQSAVTRFFDALHRSDQPMLAELVPDPALRRRLPAELGPEPACDGRHPERPATVLVAATEHAEGRAAPWSLAWTRSTRGWRLADAYAVLQ